MAKTERVRYFAACNSETGFHSFYPQVFSEDLSRVYIIKGGPGTGKSSLMRRVADRAEEKGFRVEEIYCSSDPASLDGVIAYDISGRGSLAVLDGTSPHVREMELAGARDEILYIGDFWSSEALVAQRDAIARESRSRKEAYRRLYRYLQAAGLCARNMESTISDAIDSRKIKEYVTSILTQYPIGAGFEEKTMVTRSIGMKGSFRFPTLERMADTVYVIRDCGGTAHHLLNEIYFQAQRRHMKVWVSHDPLSPEHLDGIYLPESRLSFVVAEDAAGARENIADKVFRRLSMRRFIGVEGLERTSIALAVAEKNKERLMRAAFEVLEEIRDVHFSLEQRYVSAMDFDAMWEHTEGWLKKILP